MLNSLSEQLLKAGLITQEKIDQAAQERQQQKEKAKTRQSQQQAGPKNAKPAPKQARDTKPRQNQPPGKDSKPAASKTAREASDLEQFYRERAAVERQEKAVEEQRRREAAERKKRTRQQVRELILAHQLNVEDASIRYNFVVGDTVKYLFVTEQQQQELAEGKLVITFLDGKRCLLPIAIGEQLLGLDPGKLVIFNRDESDQPLADLPSAG